MTKKKDTEIQTSEPIENSLNPTEKAAYNTYAFEWSGKIMSAPEIRVSYDDPNKGQFIIKHGDITKLIGQSLQGVILKVRHMYTLYNKNKDLSYKTNEFDSFDETITLTDGNKKVLATGTFKSVKDVIKQEYSDMKFVSILYFMYGSGLYKIYIKPASRQNLWDFQANTKGRAPFSFITELTTSTGQNGNIVYYPINFKKVSDIPSDQFKSYLNIRTTLDNNLKDSAPSAAVLTDIRTDTDLSIPPPANSSADISDSNKTEAMENSFDEIFNN